MRTVCPSCQAAYDVPAAVLATGRMLRCARCRTDFLPEAPVAPAGSPPALALADAAPDADPAPVVHVPAPAPAERLIPPETAEERVARSGPVPAVMAGWVASLVVLVALGWEFLAWHAAIQRVWPASERLYALLGVR